MTNITPDNDQFDINETGYKTTHTAVRKARRFALQGLYEWLLTDHRFAKIDRHLMGGNEPHTIAARTRADNAMHTVHLGYYHEMMRRIPEKADKLVMELAQHIDRSFDRLDPIEKAVLLIGAYELKYSLHIPYKVVLDEAMQLNTHFGATDAHKFINAVLDRYAKQTRELEYQANKTQKSTK